MYQDFMKKAGECLALSSSCLPAAGTGQVAVNPEVV